MSSRRQICPGRSSITNQILAQPPLAVPCVLAEVLPALGAWSDAAMAYVEVGLASRGSLVRRSASVVENIFSIIFLSGKTKCTKR